MTIIIPIQEYMENRDCPACKESYGRVSMKFVESKQIIDLDKKEFIVDGTIRKTCGRCGFNWIEYPAWESN